MRALVRYAGFPLLLTAAVAATYGWAGAWRVHPLIAANVVGAVLFGVLFGLERFLPHRPDWVPSDGQRLNDLGHLTIGQSIGAALGNWVVTLGFAPAGLWLATRLHNPLWPSGLPFLAQVVLVYLLADLGRYVQHRCLHRYSALWRLHALHHSVESLTLFKASRSHLAERLFSQVAMYGPLALLGAPEEVVLAYLIPNAFLGPFSHCNVDFRLGPLELLLMGPGSHRVHHSLDMREGNSNFGSALVLWDQVFGTYLNPNRRPSPARMGIEDDPVPKTFWAQMFQPFRAAPAAPEPRETIGIP
jgi:sterol desaturase/sphingolipid hydroxylase (fatty acid hydroxylase superfamily)